MSEPTLRSCEISYKEVREASSEDNSMPAWEDLTEEQKRREFENYKIRIKGWMDIGNIGR